MQQDWTLKGRGAPGDVATEIEEKVRGEHHPVEDPQGWAHGLRIHAAASIGQAIRGVGRVLVTRDHHARLEAWRAPMLEWRAEVERQREIYNALPDDQKKGFVAPKEPDFGPEPIPGVVGVQCSGSADDQGITTFALSIALAED